MRGEEFVRVYQRAMKLDEFKVCKFMRENLPDAMVIISKKCSMWQ